MKKFLNYPFSTSLDHIRDTDFPKKSLLFRVSVVIQIMLWSIIFSSGVFSLFAIEKAQSSPNSEAAALNSLNSLSETISKLRKPCVNSQGTDPNE